MNAPMPRPDASALAAQVAALLADMTQDWDTELSGAIGPATTLRGDLGFESVDVIHLVVALEEHYGSRKIPFETLLMQNGRYVDDLSVQQIAEFLTDYV